MRFTTLASWLGWLEQSHPKEIDLGLERIRNVAERMGLLHPKAKVIIVAGTNGKGSCVTACAGLLQAANYTVGVYTSPHLLHYAERIQVNGKPVADDMICAAFEKIADAAQQGNQDSSPISLTYFEYGTLAALEIFQQQQVDFMVLEVGLGGRLDAVNILDADLAVITSIAIDHQEWLGDNRELIGREKAGILREQQYFVCADENPPQTIVDLSTQLQTKAYFINRDFSYQVNQQIWQWQGKNNHSDVIALPPARAPHLPLPSLAAALQAITLFGIELSPRTIEKTLIDLHLPGRFQKIHHQQCEFIVDVAHNPAATEYLASRLRSEPIKGKTFAIVAMMADKDRLASLANLTNVIDEWYLLDLSYIPRAASVAALKENLSVLNTEMESSGNIESLMNEILLKANQNDRVLVFGSFYTVAAALTYLQIDL